MLKIYNTLARKKEEFRPLKNKRVNLFVCGPTVYDLSHIGHARTYIAFDVIVKYLRWRGYNIFYLQNITDVEDKIIERAKILTTEPLNLAQLEENEYREDMKRLGVNSVSHYARASEHIEEIIKQIETLIKNGFAYVAGGNVYFDIAKFPDYGKLSRQNIKKLRSAVRIEKDKNKRHEFDFSLWKTKKPGEVFWPSPWGEGRPGWHIEDTAISEKQFGPQYDMHGGANDLIFPHHESEIAQMEAISGKKPFVKYWLHTGHLTVQGQKMAKSLKNFITIRTFLSKFSPETLRFLTLSTHYRSPIDYNDSLAKQASNALARLHEFYEKIFMIHNSKFIIPETFKVGKTTNIESLLEKAENRFIAFMDDDFNTPKALSVIFDLVKKGNVLIDRNKLDKDAAKKILKFIKEVDSIFGILPQPEEKTEEEEKQEKELMERIQKLVKLREKYRKEKNWKKADELRKVLMVEGFLIEDTTRGARIKKVTSG